MRYDFQRRRQLALWFSGLTVAAAGWATQVDLWGQTTLPAPAAPAQQTGPPSPPAPVSALVPSVPPAPVRATAPDPAPVDTTPTPLGVPILPNVAVPGQLPEGATSGDVYAGGSFEERYRMQAAAQQWDQAAAELVQKYGQTKDEKARVALNQQLTELISKQFDRRQQFREKELKELEDKVAQLRSLHDRRTAAKGEIVRDRVNQLLRQADGLGWGSPEEENGPTPFEARYGVGIEFGVGGDVDPALGGSPDLVPSFAPAEGTQPPPGN